MTVQEVERSSRRKIGFVGTFDVANYGDCLFPVVYMHLLKQRLAMPDFSFYSPLPRSAEIMEYGPIKSLPDRLERIAFPEDVLILCGGETLWFGHSSGTFNFPASTLSAFTRLWLAPTVAASQGDSDFYVHCVGMPHSELEAPAVIAQALASATRVSVRDEVSARRLGHRFPVEVDPVFALSTIKSDAEWEIEVERWLPSGYRPGRYIAAHVSAPYLANDLHQWCEQVALVARECGMPVLLVPVCHFMDDRHTLKTAREILIALGMAETDVQLPNTASKDVISTAAMLGKSAGVITTSLHACVTAASFGVPFAAFAGHNKGNGKHRQSLLVAGIEYGISPDIPSLSQTFNFAMQQDCEVAQETAISRALAGFDEFAKMVAIPQEPTKTLSSDVVDAVVLLDTAPTQNLRFELKRTILRWMSKSRILAGLLGSRQRARIRRRVV